MNALSKQLLSSLNECLDKADKSKYCHIFKDLYNCSVIIICSASQKAFCSGADLTERLSMDIYETEAFVDQLRKTFDRIAVLSTLIFARALIIREAMSYR